MRRVLSEKLNGTLRSPVLPDRQKNISFQVGGTAQQRGPTGLQPFAKLNYKNYRALHVRRLKWETFSPPDDPRFATHYAELMTILDNPKFPDQLSALGGGDGGNYRLHHGTRAAENPRSSGMRAERLCCTWRKKKLPEVKGHLRPLHFEGAEPSSLEQITGRRFKRTITVQGV